ncbi:MAG TPA: glutamine amidotransferase [Candidatus Acidoferrales bacterium]|nr:glutamine amidotransferase [Candidatus Acidoferrales bacterium]
MEGLFFLGGVPWWAICLVAAGVCALLVYQHRQLRRRFGLPKSVLLTALRGIVYALLVLFLFNPTFLESRAAALRQPLVVLIDTSQSMNLAADPARAGSESRIEWVKKTLLDGQQPWLQRLARDYDLRLYAFGTEVKALTPGALAALQADAQGSRILDALDEAKKQAGAAGIILFTDGIANGERAAAETGALSVPVVPVGVGSVAGYVDARLADLSVPRFAFRDREVKLDLAVQAYGLKGKSLALFFNRDRNLISTRTIHVDQDPFEQKIALGYTPREVGTHSFTLSLAPQTGEEITHNNRKEFKIDVRRDKIRVLTLSGSPSWNYRFLRMALKQDPFIDLVSFVFLRTPTDSVDVPDNQLSLIPFPTDEIFLEELKNFDVVVFEDFSYRSYFNSLYLEKVRDFVRNGGGLAMLGGARSFDSGGYHETALSELLPVRSNGKGAFLTGLKYRAALTAAGKNHPVTRLLPEPQANEEMWRRMPPLSTLNPTTSGSGEVLLATAGDGADGGRPLLAVGKFGKGRTLALMSDDFWRWSFVAAGQKENPQGHLKLVRQAVRWLAQEPSFEQVEILPVGDRRAPGEKIQFKIRVLKDDFTPAAQAAVRLRVVDPEGERIPLDALPEGEQFSAEFVPAREGSYRLEAEAELAGRLLGKDSESFVVAFPYGELDDGRPRPDFLEDLARKSGGEFVPSSDWRDERFEKALARLKELAPSEIVEIRQVRLWNNLWLFSLLLALLSLEWWCRRRWGLI